MSSFGECTANSWVKQHRCNEEYTSADKSLMSAYIAVGHTLDTCLARGGHGLSQAVLHIQTQNPRSQMSFHPGYPNLSHLDIAQSPRSQISLHIPGYLGMSYNLSHLDIAQSPRSQISLHISGYLGMSYILSHLGHCNRYQATCLEILGVLIWE